MSPLRKIYVSGALMASVDIASARAKYEACASVLERAGYEPYLPHRRTDPEAASDLQDKAVFSHDMKALLGSDAVVAFLDEPSHGVGAELAICAFRRIPTLALAPIDARISRFISGMLEESGQSALVPFKAIADLETIVPDQLERLLSKRGLRTPSRLWQ
ncbi:hypothetical protein IVA86_00265 [Bradyrhizobium sp. 146]|uniref:nucleoside 2-deoxyribosyltransferase n=1 Tax=Bradyrhizobium sp. 146 TaxID=2782622 RepID=UPI001FFB7B77|nr:nucleoside 2-deoxyribosyltransferase [Bradyrhizobium sp. 146]MCK1699912.1 hypothetical protein [Bradyrhizobium sp. 146]